SLTLGSHTITATYNGDTNGNLASTSPPLTQIVTLAPTTTSLVSSANPSTPGQSVTFTATVSGSGSPTGTVQFKDGATNLGAAVTLAGGTASFTTSSLSTGGHSITAVYGGDSNNGTSSGGLTQTVGPTTTSTSVTSSLNPSTPGQSVTFTATVTGASPTGTVQFKDGAAILGTVALAGGVASLTTSSLSTGGHSITAVYGGDANNTASTSAALTQTVNQAASSTTVTSSLNPSTPGQSVTFTATVTGASPTGTVQFKDGAANLGAAVTLAGGVAAFTTSSLAAGSHSITAVYSGDGNNTASTSAALVQTVNQAASTTTVTSSLNPSAPGQSVTFTATVTGASPTGTVQFKDGAANLGAAVTLAGGVATLTTSSLATGSHSITVVYSGDGNNTASTSAALTQTVNKAATSTSLVSSLNPSTPGQSVTFTATVTGASPTGTVQFKDGAANLGAAVTLAGGVATFATSSLVTGSHTITAVYSGDGNNTTSISAELAQTVNKGATSTSLVSSLNPSTPGQSVTFTATVTGASPTGTVQFKDGAANLGAAVTLAGGVATFTTSTLASGSHSITATYGGDGNNTPSTSAALAQSVNQSATTTTLSSSANPSQVGQAVTFAATVTSGGGTPAGTVTFKDGAAVIGNATLGGSGVATLTISSLTLGSHSITAIYGGSAAFVTSTSTALIQAVSTPADSLKLRAMQTLAAPVVAQNSGAAISGAIDSAISEAFGGDGTFMTPTGSGMRINFAADPDGKSAAEGASRSADPFAGIDGSSASNGHGFAAQMPPGNTARSTSRIDDAFGAMAYAAPTKAPPRYVEQRDWLGWAEVRGAVLDRWGTGTGAVGTVAGASMLYGNQVNLIAGLTRRLSSNFVVGVLGGYETFDYRSDALQGRLKGDGWTVGSYLGWKLTQTIRFDAGVSYSGIGYDGTAGTASGNFGGERWMVSSGLTGSYQGFGLQFEPSARIYALWEHESAYTDSLGTLQTARDFSTGRASAGVKVAYPVAWSSTVALAPYVGLYGDYYFNSDNATAALAASGLPGAVVLDGFSARAIGGVTARFANGGQVALGAEFAGIGGSASVWIYRARASVPF
ncbi:MAG TPA: Ig-like domain repeat protein, partial [Bradyrhizobium sp.]